MPLTTEQRIRRDRLQVAYDQLITGQNATMIQSGGRKTEFGPGDASTVRAELDQLNALTTSRGRTRGAIRFRF